MKSAIESFRAEDIPVFKPGELEYERSVVTTNRLYRFSRPDCVVKPKAVSHVQTVIKLARSRNLAVTIKNGGHSYAGFSTAYKGILLDLREMKEVRLDMESNIVTLEGGALWGHAYKQLVNDRHYGVIINGGRCPTVGVSGFMLGGGLGPFTRSFGMGCDTMKEATVVTADGEKVTVKDSNDPSSDKGRLFWALRGAGGGNFGVLVKMKLELQRLKNRKGFVVSGKYRWLPKSESLDDLVATMNGIYTTNWPNQMTIDSTWLCELKGTSSELGVRFITYYDGNKDDFENLIDKSVKNTDLAKQLKRRSLSERSTLFLHETLDEQWSEEIKAPSENKYSIYTSFVLRNDKESIGKITAIIRDDMKAFRSRFTGEQAAFRVTWIHAGGKVSEKGPSETAFHWREGVYHTYATIEWEDKWLQRDMRGFLQQFKEKLRPLSIKGTAAFINFPDSALSEKAHERAYYGDNREELQRIKGIWDPDGFFKWTQGVQLPGPSQEPAMTWDKEPVTNTTGGDQWEHYQGKDFAAELAELEDFL